MSRLLRHAFPASLVALVAGACVAPRERAADTPTDSVTPYAMAPIPDGPLGAAIRRGAAILRNTPDSLPDHVGNDLSCFSCHLDQGFRPDGNPLVGTFGRFPQYNGRAARVFTIEDRINGCLQRSMNGSAMPADDPRMRDIVAWMAHASRNIPVGASVPGQGVPKPTALGGDTVAGAQVWATTCARCHGPDGQGSDLAPPVWGPRSFNIGAGMARFRTAAGFIRHNMPFDQPGTLTDQQALDVAAYVTSRPRPDLPGKEHDWPNGGAPEDAAYPVLSMKR